MQAESKSMETIVALAKNRGFIFPGSDIYGGLANTWDYGPYGAALKRNIKECWWQSFVKQNLYNVGLDASILMNPEVWVASGHVASFSDPKIDCRECKARYRTDQLIEDYAAKHGIEVNIEAMSDEELDQFIVEHQVKCPACGNSNFTETRKFNLMFKTHQGVTEEGAAAIYLRPETAQGIFVNYRNVQRSSRRKIPFGIAQIGKSFRNEITPGNFVFRTREFEQMELEFFCEPGTDLEWFQYWRNFCHTWLLSLGIPEEELRLRDHDPQELAFYSKATTDFEFNFPFGWGELWGIADRTDYDLKQHMEHSRKNLMYHDPHTNQEYIPYVIEPSLGVERVLLAFLCSAYDEETLENGETRTVLRFHPALAPVKIAVLPLSTKLAEPAQTVYQELVKHFEVEFDDRQSIGKRYRRQDEIGTPYCLTFDFDSLEDNCVTIRDRDSMQQERIAIADLVDYFRDKFVFEHHLGN